MKLLRTILFGVPVFSLLTYPVVFGAIAYEVLSLLGVHRKFELTLALGYISLALLPCYILGHVFRTVFLPEENGNANKKNDKGEELSPGLDRKELVEIWKKCVDVQTHFNEIELQIRNYAVTLLVAVIGAAAYALNAPLKVKLFDHTFSMAVAIFPAGILGWYAFYFMDRHWYHRLLLGSVKHAEKIEKAVGPELQLTVAISAKSPIPISVEKKIHSTERIDLFYAAGLTFLVVLTGFALLHSLGTYSQ